MSKLDRNNLDCQGIFVKYSICNKIYSATIGSSIEASIESRMKIKVLKMKGQKTIASGIPAYQVFR